MANAFPHAKVRLGHLQQARNNNTLRLSDQAELILGLVSMT